ncbi:AI-2E family transporter [Vulgatibacter incomptus]|uniref:Membrane protein, putative n=1 Tax=Vulgatibacter incomptus TaxID=1391653 RepID=A0A0K1PBJ9_9BACT|nr:AI-2E family transporter [Vulgatibacter incomptus]AKU90499.1 membrane protein, putative [Vulgatibacter incomptus]
MTDDRRLSWADATFAVLFFVASVAFFWTISSFVVPLFLAAAGVAVIAPANEWLSRKMKGRRSLASLTSSIVTILVILVPSAFVGYLLIKAGANFVMQWKEAIERGGLHELLSGQTREPLAPLLAALDRLGLEDTLRQGLDRTATYFSTHLASAAASIARILLQAFVVVLGMYYFFLEGPRMVKDLVTLLPMEEAHTTEILRDMAGLLRALFLASFVTAAIQGVLGVIGFWIVGLPNALTWAALMTFFAVIFSLIPILGTGLVWVPVTIWLFANGKILSAIFMLVWGAIILGSVEYFVKPYFTKARLQINPLVLFLTLFGGIDLLGPIGALAGPMLSMMVVSFIRVWKRDILPEVAPTGFH